MGWLGQNKWTDRLKDQARDIDRVERDMEVLHEQYTTYKQDREKSKWHSETFNEGRQKDAEWRKLSKDTTAALTIVVQWEAWNKQHASILPASEQAALASIRAQIVEFRYLCGYYFLAYMGEGPPWRSR